MPLRATLSNHIIKDMLCKENSSIYVLGLSLAGGQRNRKLPKDPIIRRQ